MGLTGERLLATGLEYGVTSANSPPTFVAPLSQQPALQLIYDTAPIGLAVFHPTVVISRSISA